MTWTTRPERDSVSAWITTALSGFSARSRSMLARTAPTSTTRLSTQTWPFSRTATMMFPFFTVSAVLALGRFISTPDSLTNEVVTMKKISMMNTMSSMGVRSMAASSAPLSL